MWLWQHKKLKNRFLLWLKLFFVCFIIHVSFLLCFFFNPYCNNYYRLSVALDRSRDYSLPIMFVPTTYSVPVEPIQQPLASKKSIVTAEQSVQKATHKKETSITQPPKPVQKTVRPKPESIVAKKREPAPQPEKIIAPQQDHEPKNLPKKKNPIVHKKNAIISHDYREVESIRRMSLLQQKLIAQWRPPLGVPHDAVCDIACTVNDAGIITTMNVVRSSHIPLYDLSAKHALHNTKLPEWTRNKTITINFKQ